MSPVKITPARIPFKISFSVATVTPKSSFTYDNLFKPLIILKAKVQRS